MHSVTGGQRLSLRAKQSSVIPVETVIQEGRIAMRPYRIASGTGILPVIPDRQARRLSHH